MECSFINVNFASFLHLLLFSFGFSSCLFSSYIFILSLESQTHKSQTRDQPQLCLELPPDLIRPPTPPPPQSWLEGSYELGSVSVLLLGR